MTKRINCIGNAIRWLPLVLCTFILTGCVKEYDTRDAVSYVEEKYRITAHIEVEGVEVEGEDGYTDTLWTMVDEENGIKFHVVDDHYWGMESVTNALYDDYENSLFLVKAPEVEGLTYETSTDEDGLIGLCVTGAYRNRAELAAQYEALAQLLHTMQELGYGDLMDNISYRIEYQNPLRNVASDYEVDDGDSHGILEYIDEDDLQEFEDRYLMCALDYRFEDALAEFTEEEIETLVATNDEVYHIGRVTADETDWYPDLCASRYAYGVSYGTLYEILQREGFKVDGTVWHYTFTAEDNTYEISYDFYDEGYYYLQNGGRVYMGADFYNHFWTPDLHNMTGLDLEIARGLDKYMGCDNDV